MQIEVVADGLGFTEGPVQMPDGRVALVSMSHGCVYLVDPAGGALERIDVGGGPNGLTLGPDGALYVAQNGGVFDASGSAPAGVQVVRDGRVEYLTTGMGAPNDLTFWPDGRLWVTDPRPGVAAGESPAGWVWRCSTEGDREAVLTDGPVFVNGLGFTADGSLLVTSTRQVELIGYRLAADPSEVDLPGSDSPGTDASAAAPELLGAPRVLHRFERGFPDGLAIDASGRAWVALTVAHRLDVIDPDGSRSAVIDLPDGSLPTNVCFGATEDEVYVTASYGQALLRVRPPWPNSTPDGG